MLRPDAVLSQMLSPVDHAAAPRLASRKKAAQNRASSAVRRVTGKSARVRCSNGSCSSGRRFGDGREVPAERNPVVKAFEAPASILADST